MVTLLSEVATVSDNCMSHNVNGLIVFRVIWEIVLMGTRGPVQWPVSGEEYLGIQSKFRCGPDEFDGLILDDRGVGRAPHWCAKRRCGLQDCHDWAACYIQLGPRHVVLFFKS